MNILKVLFGEGKDDDKSEKMITYSLTLLQNHIHILLEHTPSSNPGLIAVIINSGWFELKFKSSHVLSKNKKNVLAGL